MRRRYVVLLFSQANSNISSTSYSFVKDKQTAISRQSFHFLVILAWMFGPNAINDAP
jgi:hypothetical protein